MTLHLIPLNFLIYKENFILFFISVLYIVHVHVYVCLYFAASFPIYTACPNFWKWFGGGGGGGGISR